MLPQRAPNIDTQIALDIGQTARAMVEDGLSTLDMLEQLSVRYPHSQWTLDSVERLARQVADRRPQARRYLQAKSVDMARNLVENGKPSDHVRALEGLGEVLDAGQEHGGGITVIVGAGSQVQINLGRRETE
jgi:hypothetical protein